MYIHLWQVLINNKKAVGVEFIRNGRKERVLVGKEIILSAGAVGSPQILMLSGIGPKEHLKEMNVRNTVTLTVHVFIC